MSRTIFQPVLTFKLQRSNKLIETVLQDTGQSKKEEAYYEKGKDFSSGKSVGKYSNS
jgi:hypothetical protein